MSVIFHVPAVSEAIMSSYYNSLQHSSNVSEVSSTSPSPGSCNTQRYGTVVPNRVFVGGIASNTTELELKELFAQYGNVQEINIISDRGGVCKGYGFVTFETEEEAKRVQQEPDAIILKERKLNIGQAVIKQQPFNRPYEQGGTLLYHNGTPYTYQHGMAYFPAPSSAPAQPPYSVGGSRESSMYAAPFGPGQTTSSPALMYPAYAPPVPVSYLTPGQQYQFSLPLEYFKTLGQTPSQFVYAQHNPMNGTLSSALNGGTSQSPSPSYGQQVANGANGPSQAHGTAFYHAGSELYYNGNAHPSQPQMLYPMEPSPASQSEDWGQATPVVSLLKLHEAGSVEELEITRTPRKLRPVSPSGAPQVRPQARPQPRSRRPGRSGSASRFTPAPNSCLHRSSSVSPSGQVSPAYSGGRQPQQQHPHGIPHHQGQSYYQPRRGGGGNSMRSSGPRNNSGMSRSCGPYSNSYSSGPRMSSTSHNSGQNAQQKVSNLSRSTGSTCEPVNSPKISPILSPSQSPGINVHKLDKGGAGDAPDPIHSLPLSPPDTPLSHGASDHKASGDSSICQKMQALAV